MCIAVWRGKKKLVVFHKCISIVCEHLRIGKKTVEATVITNLDEERSEAEVEGKISKEGGESNQLKP